MEKFNFRTAWIFASVTADDGVDLPLLNRPRLTRLNHAIPTRGQITRALKALYACGLVDINGVHVQLTPHGRAVADDGFARRGGRFCIPDNMRKSLDAAKPSIGRLEARPFVYHRRIARGRIPRIPQDVAILIGTSVAANKSWPQSPALPGHLRCFCTILTFPYNECVT